MSKTIKYKEYLDESLKNIEEAAEYLNAALKEGDLSLFALALKDVANALGGGIGSGSKTVFLIEKVFIECFLKQEILV